MDWPLVGRREQLQRIAAALGSRDGGRLVLHGPAGVGKTRLLTEARSRAIDRGVEVRWILATSASSATPFGPFAHVLPPDLDAGQPGGMLGAAVAYLASGGASLVLAVDDAQLLDPGSAALLQHLAHATPVRFVVTVRDGEPVPDGVTALWKDLGVPRLRLTELARDEVGDALASAFGGDVSSSLVDELARLSHGNPLLLRELATAAMAAGAIDQRAGIWVATGPLVSAPDLPSVIAGRLDRLAPAVRAGCELVALSEPVGASIVEELLSPEIREQLDREQLLAVVPDRRRVQLRLVHPLYTEALRATVPPLRAREHARRLAGALARAGMRRKEDRMRVAVWHLAAGRRDQPDLYLAACREADAAQDHDLAVRLAEAAVDGGGLDAEVALLRQLPYVGRRDEALARVEELAAAAINMSDVVDVAVTHAHLHIVAGDLERARHVLHDAQRAVTTPELGDRLQIQLLEVAYAAGDVAGSTGVLDRLLAHAMIDPDVLVAAAPSGVRALAMAGRTRGAVALADRALDAIDEGAVAAVTVRDSIAMARLHAVGYDGDMARALEGGQAGAAQSRGSLRAMWLRDAGQALLLTGRPRSSVAALREMMAELPLAGLAPGSAMWALDAMAEASALLGDVAGARGHLDELDRRRPPGFQPPRTAGATWAAAASGDQRRAREIARQAATLHADRGALVHSALALYDIARLGATAEITEELAQVAARCQGALVPALARAARCIAEGDVDALNAESRGLERQGMMLFAAELAAQAAALLRQRGRTGSAWITAHRASELASRCEDARTPLLHGLDDRGGLTEREWEIAALVAQGLSDREVASRLQLSVRTVHSHLHHTYRKLGVSGREELARRLGDGAAADEHAR